MDNHATIVIKKVKKGGHGGHHGGAWKVAYADFVTAMMAFFLLLWLLNATTEEQKMGISNYFDPTAISRATRSGSGGVLGGTSITVPGALKSPSSPPQISTPQVARPQAERTEALDPDSDDPENIESRLGSRQDEEGVSASQEALEQLLREREQQQFEDAETAIKEAIQESPELGEVAGSLKIDATPDGLRIQLIDQERVALFPNGSASMYDTTRQLLTKVAEIVAKLPNKIEITGHTDSKQFAPGSTYTNWDLSSDRANASRRVLVANGIDESRISEVVGKADRDPLVDDPSDPTNRRISIILKHLSASDAEGLKLAEDEARRRAAQAAGSPTGTPAPDDRGSPPAIDRGGPVVQPPRVGG
ncbi:membrane protein [Thalassobaculum fulvum]|uniref:Membrane protein n=1 Tax=Thalassobaculum fulvum TaxID=1633335 RepID=A0A918XQX8_9PROT|nr:flagellar motor protein MotB [Thalassobaculum fulvum]GHD48600.1 membrane protein [Thalassobaculum fulvum]